MSQRLTDLMLKREAECVRWCMTGREGDLDASRWVTVYDFADDQVLLSSKADKAYRLRIPVSDLDLSLDMVSERHIKPFVSQLPSVLASARVKGDAEYASWGPA